MTRLQQARAALQDLDLSAAVDAEIKCRENRNSCAKSSIWILNSTQGKGSSTGTLISMESFQQKLQSQPMAAGDVEKQVILFRNIIAQRDKFLNVKLQTQIGPVCARPLLSHVFLSLPDKRFSVPASARSPRKRAWPCPAVRFQDI